MVHRESTEIETVRVIHVPPNPHIFKGLGLGQSFEAAVADLIDNSLDVGASRVAVRFVLRREKLVQLLIIDNGSGMNQKSIDAAMQLGRPRKKSETKPRSVDAPWRGVSSLIFTTILAAGSG